MTNKNHSKNINRVLWIAQIILALLFLITGVTKLVMPAEFLHTTFTWTKETNLVSVRLIGFFEIMGSMGLILPSWLRIKPQLTPFAAVGIAVIMLLASILHISRGEFSELPINIIVLFMSAFIVMGRLKKSPIPAKHFALE